MDVLCERDNRKPLLCRDGEGRNSCVWPETTTNGDLWVRFKNSKDSQSTPLVPPTLLTIKTIGHNMLSRGGSN